MPLCIYSNPGTTNFTFKPEMVARLAAIPTVGLGKEIGKTCRFPR